MKEKLGKFVAIRTGKLDANASSENGKYPFFTCSITPLKIDTYSYDCECVLVAGNGDLNVKYYKGKFDAYQRTYIIESSDKDILSVKYLYLFLEYYIEELRRLSVGGVIKYIRLSNLTDALINVPSWDIQKEIIERLEKLLNTISKRKEQLAKLDELAKSRFIEMFGQCGEDRFGWGVSKLGDCCIINPSKSTEARLEDELEVSFCPMPYVSELGDIKTDETKLYKDVKSGFTYFAEEDVLFAKITPCMENGKGAIARNLKNGIGFGSTEFHILRPNRSIITPEWLYVLTTFKQFRKDAEANMTGSAGQKRVPSIFLRNYKISIPPLELQKQYVGILEQLDKSKFRIKKCLKMMSFIRHL